MGQLKFIESEFIDSNLETLPENIKNLDFKSIFLQASKPMYDNITDYADENRPIFFEKGGFWSTAQLTFEKNFYLNHKEKLDKIIIEYIKNYSGSSFEILCNEMISDELLKALAANPNIKKINLGNHGEPFTLTSRVIDLFKDSNVERIYTQEIAPELEEDFRPIIGYNSGLELVESYTYQELQKTGTISIYEELSKEEIKNLKYLKKDCQVIITYGDNSSFLDTIKELLRLNPKRTIKINVANCNKNKFTRDILSSGIEGLLDTNIEVYLFSPNGMYDLQGLFSLKQYLDHETRLYKMIEPALGLSPLEKYLFAYNVVKKFKPYKDNRHNLSDSRELYKILDNKYIVCEGYANLLQDLLEKLGIPAHKYLVLVSTAYDGVPNKERVAKEEQIYEGHAREEVYINDPKYGVDGMYICDPTWDNCQKHDYYNFALITHDDYNKMYRENQLSFAKIQEVFFVSSIEEFYSKANLWMNKAMLRDKSPSPERIVLKEIKNRLRMIDEKAFEKLIELNPRFSDEEYIPNGKNKVDFLKYIISYITYTNTVHPGALCENAPLGGYTNLFQASTSEEFYKAYYKMVSSNKPVEKPIEHRFVTAVLEHLELLFPEFTNEIYDKYHIERNQVTQSIPRYEKPDYYGAITAIGEFVVDKVNNKISGSVLREAITEIYRKCYGVGMENDNLKDFSLRQAIARFYRNRYGISTDVLESKIDKVFEENAKRHEKTYPIRTAILSDGTSYPLNETENIFETKAR